MSYFVYTMAINFAIKAWELLPKIPVADPASSNKIKNFRKNRPRYRESRAKIQEEKESITIDLWYFKG